MTYKLKLNPGDLYYNKSDLTLSLYGLNNKYSRQQFLPKEILTLLYQYDNTTWIVLYNGQRFKVIFNNFNKEFLFYFKKVDINL